MRSELTAATLAAFVRQAAEWRPAEADAARAALESLVSWSEQQTPALVPLPAGSQQTVAFGLTADSVLWRAYPGRTVPAKVAILPGVAPDLPTRAKDPLAAALSTAVPGASVAVDGHLQCHLAPLADPSCFDRFTVFLAAVHAFAMAIRAPVG